MAPKRQRSNGCAKTYQTTKSGDCQRTILFFIGFTVCHCTAILDNNTFFYLPKKGYFLRNFYRIKMLTINVYSYGPFMLQKLITDDIFHSTRQSKNFCEWNPGFGVGTGVSFAVLLSFVNRKIHFSSPLTM